MDLFEAAVRKKLRFPSGKGLLTVEDLWDLPLTSAKPTDVSVQSVATPLFARQNELSGVQSIFEANAAKPSPEKVTVDLQVEIIKHVVATRRREADAATLAAAKASERAVLQAQLAKKKLEGASVEDLERQLAALN